MPIPIDTCSNNLKKKKKPLKNDSHFALREDKPSLSSLVWHFRNSHTPDTLLHFHSSTKLPHATREEILSAGQPIRSKNNFRGITMGRGPIWGINSLSFILLWRLLNQNTKNFPSKSFKLDSFVSDRNHFLKLTFLSGCYLIQWSYLCIPCMLYVTQNMRRTFLKKTWIYIYCNLKLHAINSVKKIRCIRTSQSS